MSYIHFSQIMETSLIFMAIRVFAGSGLRSPSAAGWTPARRYFMPPGTATTEACVLEFGRGGPR